MADAELVPFSQGIVARRASVALEPVMDVATALARMAKLQEFCAHYLQESTDGGNDGGDYGVIPGAGKKKVLLKSGADKLCDVYALADTYLILSKTEDFTTGLFEYTLECRLQSKVDDSLVGSGLGSCSSFESKYRWRGGSRTCPTCGKADTIIKGKAEYGGGWLCFAKKGGCGAKFTTGDKAIEGQQVGRVENPDIIDTRNTVLKMAKKRAKVDAVIGVTRSSGIFTQDMEETEPDRTHQEPVMRRDTTREARADVTPSAPDRTATDPLHGDGLCGATEIRTTGDIAYWEVALTTDFGEVLALSTRDSDLADLAVLCEGKRVYAEYKRTAKGGLMLLTMEPLT